MKRLLIIAAAALAAVIAPTAAHAQSATPSISLIHGIPGTTVDLVVDGTVVLNAFAPGSIVDITSFAGRTLTNVEVKADGTDDVVIGPIASLDIPATGNWSIVAHLNASGTATLSSFQNNLAAPASGKARLTVRHTAAAGPVDLIIGDQRPVTNAANGASAELELDAGELANASIAPTGQPASKEITGVTLVANTNTILYVVGSESEDTIAFVVQVIEIPAAADSTTTSTTVAGATTTTTSPTPSAVNTGAPIDGTSTNTLLIVALGGLVLAGGAFVARRRV